MLSAAQKRVSSLLFGKGDDDPSSRRPRLFSPDEINAHNRTFVIPKPKKKKEKKKKGHNKDAGAGAGSGAGAAATHQSSYNSSSSNSSSKKKNNNHNSKNTFWCVVDGFVVEATTFVDEHPGGLKKIMSTDEPNIGATGKAFGFSLGRGRNAHFPDTAKRFRDGVELYLSGGGGGKGEEKRDRDDDADDDGGKDDDDGAEEEQFLPPLAVDFPPYEGNIVILGRLAVSSSSEGGDV